MRLRSNKPKYLLNNVVAKYAKKYNVAVTHKDKKKASKRGYSKHKSIHVD